MKKKPAQFRILDFGSSYWKCDWICATFSATTWTICSSAHKANIELLQIVVNIFYGAESAAHKKAHFYWTSQKGFNNKCHSGHSAFLAGLAFLPQLGSALSKNAAFMFVVTFGKMLDLLPAIPSRNLFLKASLLSFHCWRSVIWKLYSCKTRIGRFVKKSVV